MGMIQKMKNMKEQRRIKREAKKIAREKIDKLMISTIVEIADEFENKIENMPKCVGCDSIAPFSKKTMEKHGVCRSCLRTLKYVLKKRKDLKGFTVDELIESFKVMKELGIENDYEDEGDVYFGQT